MFGLEKHIKNAALDKDTIAELLHTSPENLQCFENIYCTQVLDQGDPEEFFQINSRQAAVRKHENSLDGIPDRDLERRIVSELIAQTAVYAFDRDLNSGQTGTTRRLRALPGSTRLVTKDEVNALPPSQRPQLAGRLMKVDMNIPSYQTLFMYYKKYLDNPGTKLAQTTYHQFRQGLDILDLDPVTYEMLGMNKNSMGYWLPALVNACQDQDFFKIPATRVTKVPMSLLQLTRIDYEDLTAATLRIVDDWAKEAFCLDEKQDYFIKTGTYSSKFDFRNAHVHGAKEVNELGEYLLYIHFQALQMASPLSQPCIYGVSTTNE